MDSSDIPDSTDWIGTPLAGLMQVEQAFRCHVCKDLYKSPMITSCNHTFCSICIRRSLSENGKCPLCRALDQESKLRGNWALREAVDAFVASRDGILQFAKTPAPAPVAKSPKRKASELSEPIPGSQNKRTRMSTRASKAKAAETTSAMMREEVDLLEREQTPEYEPEPEPEPDDGLVECPICWKRMKPWQVDRHIDNSCPGTPQPQKSTASLPTSIANTRTTSGSGSARSLFTNPPTPTKAPERLPALAYSMLKDNALRKKMSELGLSTVGSRQLLEKRHQEWITLWNANCDAARPKKRFELMQDLDVWERTLGGRAPTTSRAATTGAQIRDKDFDGAAWATKHDTSFRDLIAKARGARGKPGAQRPVQDETKENETVPESPVPNRGGTRDGPVEAAPPPADLVDLTIPPSSQPEPPDSPPDGPRRLLFDSPSNAGRLAETAVLYPPAGSIPPQQPGAPS